MDETLLLTSDTMTHYIKLVAMDDGNIIPPDELVRRIVENGRDHGVTLKEIAERMDVTRMTVFRWMKSYTLPSIAQIDALLAIEGEFQKSPKIES